MPRPQRCRKICGEPAFTGFTPDSAEEVRTVTLTFDEFEVIRLVDYERLTHEQCAAQMDISRTTATEIYQNAREKIADCLVNGRRLIFAGGNYRICSGESQGCRQRHCEKQTLADIHQTISKGDIIMKIAVTYEDGQIFGHFGHTEQFKLYEVADGKVVSSQVVSTDGNGHGALAGFLAAHQVNILICGGIGGGAQTALAQAGIQLFGGVSGSADEAVEALLAGTLAFNPNVRCNHHEHGEEGHSCGSHGCGDHGCH